MNDFALDLDRIRLAAREHIEAGPVTDAYGVDVARVIDVLNEVLATELVCVLRYKRHYYMATGLHGPAVAAVERLPVSGACFRVRSLRQTASGSHLFSNAVRLPV